MTKILQKTFIDQQEKKLKEEKRKIEEELSKVAIKNKKLKDDWITKFPYLDNGHPEIEMDQFEEYENILSIASTLELELKRINEALKKIKKGGYGICEKCQRPISKGRLNIYPQAAECLKCQK